MKYDLIAVAGWTDWISACQIIAQNMKDLGIDITCTDARRKCLVRRAFQGQPPVGDGLEFGRAYPL